MTWRRTFLLAVVFASLFSVVLGDGGRAMTEVGKLAKKTTIALFAAPLSLLDERSPGGRGHGTLLSTKSEPYERVLAAVRDRLSPSGGSPVVSIDIPPGTFEPISNSQSAENILPEALTLGSLASQPFAGFPDSSIIGDGFVPLSNTTTPQGTSSSQVPPPTQGTSPSGPSGDLSSPPGQSGDGTPPGQPGGSSSPPGQSGSSSPPTGTIQVLEPAPWTILIFGLPAIVVASRRGWARRRA